MLEVDPLLAAYQDASLEDGEVDDVIQEIMHFKEEGKNRRQGTAPKAQDELTALFNNENEDTPPWYGADEMVIMALGNLSAKAESESPAQVPFSAPSVGTTSGNAPTTCEHPISTSLLLGYGVPEKRRSIGFTSNMDDTKPEKSEAVTYDGEGHLITVGSTGSGKGVSCIIPNLLTYTGPAFVIDIKGEAALQTAGYRRDLMGQKVLIVDPWKLVVENTDALNPLDSLDMYKPGYFEAALALAGLILPVDAGEKKIDPHWAVRGRAIIAGLLMLIARHFPDHARHLQMLGDIFALRASDFAKLLVAMDRSPVPEIAQSVGQILAAPDKERASIFSTILRAVTPWSSKFLVPAISKSNIKLDEVTEGVPLTIYFVVPPQYLKSHGNVLSAWIGTLLNALLKRTPGQNLPKTLFVLDEAANLGYMPQIPVFYSLARGYGVRVWTFWQSVSQLLTVYPEEYENLIDQAHVLQGFGITNYRMANQIANLVGNVTGEELLNMPADQCLVHCQTFPDRKPRFLTKPNYLTNLRLWGRSGISLN
ncbi:hypothetical protein MTBLM1_80035 [Rhodospirillaceae bacterium LM-1]|nr:hypothetical protein MTBLM1_80035 [Rhodospirillaceae bacterium LM-1]